MLTFTIITCTYNASEYVGRTMESVAGQTYPHVQHLIQDGASSDDTLRIVGHYERAEVVSEKDGGLYDAMNRAIIRAKGDYIVFLNAGDKLYSPTTLEELARKVKGYDSSSMPAVLYGDTNIVDERGKYIGPRHLLPPEKLSWRSFRNGMLVCHQAFYVRTDIARQVPYDLRYRLSADVDWCIRVMKEAERQHLELLNTHLTLCDFLEGGMTKKNHRASLKERFRVMVRHYGLLMTVYKHFTFLFR